MRGGLPDAVRRRLDPAERFGLRVTLLAVAFTLLAVPFGLLLTQVLTDGPLVRVDTAAARGLHVEVLADGRWVRPLQVVSATGTGPFLWLIVGAAVVFWWVRVRRVAVFLALTTLLGSVISSVVKELVDRERPSVLEPVAAAYGKSFPSGHAMASTVCYGALLLAFLPLVPRARRRWLVVGVVCYVLAIGFTRLALGVHYVSDVIGGIVLGLAWLCVTTAAFQVWRREQGRRPTDPLREGLEPSGSAQR